MNRRNFFTRAVGAAAALLHKPVPTPKEAGYLIGADLACGPDTTCFSIMESTANGLNGLNYWIDNNWVGPSLSIGRSHVSCVGLWPENDSGDSGLKVGVEYWRES